MKETTKATKRRKTEALFVSLFKGKVLDIGGGDDPLNPDDWPDIDSVECVDQFPPHAWRGEKISSKIKRTRGDAMNLKFTYPPNSFDVVHSSQCLEHMVNPHGAIADWWTLVKPGGYLVVTVPDEDLYEKCSWPPRFNTDHKFTFRLSEIPVDHNVGGCTPVSINMLALAKSLWSCEVHKLLVVDTNYDYDKGPEIDQTLEDAEAFIELVCKKK